MRVLRALLVAVCLAVFVAPSALAAPTLPPTFYLPTQAEVPPGFTITRTSAVGTYGIRGGSFEQEQHYSAPEAHAFANTRVTVFSDRTVAAQSMALKRQGAPSFGNDVFAATVGDESYVTIHRGMYTDYFGFVVRHGLVIADTTLFTNAGVSEANAATIGYALMGVTLTRMAEHPDGV